jgi:D-alanine transaminase
MATVFFNGKFIPKEEIKISPDDRGFLFADGIYEVMKWYKGFFYDIESHHIRMKRSLKEINIKWPEEDTFPDFATELIRVNNLANRDALIYLQVTRGASPRSHTFPVPPVSPTVYAFVNELIFPAAKLMNGVKVMLKEDIRWSRCDIKSIALLPNILSLQEAQDKGFAECIFVRDGLITEGTRSNIFFRIDDVLYTHPENNHILSGITRKNILRIAKESGFIIKEEALPEKNLRLTHEAFITNTSAEITPVTMVGEHIIGDGKPGPASSLLREKFDAEILSITG